MGGPIIWQGSDARMLNTGNLLKSDGTVYGGGAIGNAFTTMQPVTGTSPVAGSSTDTLTFANTDGRLTILGNSGAKSLTFGMVALTATLGITVDGGTSVLTTGFKGYLQVPFACTITSWSIMSTVSGSCVVDITNDTFANWPPAASITASAKPTLTTATKATSSTLTGWTTAVAADTVIGFNITSVTSCTKIIVQLKVTRT